MTDYKQNSVVILVLMFLILIQGCVSSNKKVELTFLCNELGKKTTDVLPDSMKSIILRLHEHKCNGKEGFSIEPQLLTFKPNQILFPLSSPQSAQEKFFGTTSASKLEAYIDTFKIGNNFIRSNKFTMDTLTKITPSYDIVAIFNKDSTSIQVKDKIIYSKNNVDELLNEIIPSICGGSTKKAKKVLICYNIFDGKPDTPPCKSAVRKTTLTAYFRQGNKQIGIDINGIIGEKKLDIAPDPEIVISFPLCKTPFPDNNSTVEFILKNSKGIAYGPKQIAVKDGTETVIIPAGTIASNSTEIYTAILYYQQEELGRCQFKATK